MFAFGFRASEKTSRFLREIPGLSDVNGYSTYLAYFTHTGVDPFGLQTLKMTPNPPDPSKRSSGRFTQPGGQGGGSGGGSGNRKIGGGSQGSRGRGGFGGKGIGGGGISGGNARPNPNPPSGGGGTAGGFTLLNSQLSSYAPANAGDQGSASGRAGMSGPGDNCSSPGGGGGGYDPYDPPAGDEDELTDEEKLELIEEWVTENGFDSLAEAIKGGLQGYAEEVYSRGEIPWKNLLGKLRGPLGIGMTAIDAAVIAAASARNNASLGAAMGDPEDMAVYNAMNDLIGTLDGMRKEIE
jgi:hypothetical protein